MVSSEALENDNNPDADRRNRVRDMLSMATARQETGKHEATRARTLAGRGFGAYDALHLACAEAAGADVLLTTDDRFLKKAERVGDELHVKVCSPVLWLEEK